ncbi:MAG: 16S rRNA (guanine(527)-N(7))-methyltransferase RsmG [Hahellaceae bacterium]|nr:16S rRNA (guanine(527)-N(7))-methyltransferase RsmG [Hahellaceae bacterium]
MNRRFEQRLSQGIEQLGLVISAEKQQKLLDYLDLLVKWNGAYNLTAVRDPEEMLERHLLDSLSVVPYVQGPRLLDVGTGPGLPGIPLAICFPEIHVTLLDSNGKKTRFLTQAKMSLRLENVEVFYGRAEACRSEPFDQIVSRAFSSLENMVNWTRHLLAEDGHFLAMKGLHPGEEIEHLPVGFAVKTSHRLDVPSCEGERHLIIISSQTH